MMSPSSGLLFRILCHFRDISIDTFESFGHVLKRLSQTVGRAVRAQEQKYVNSSGANFRFQAINTSHTFPWYRTVRM